MWTVSDFSDIVHRDNGGIMSGKAAKDWARKAELDDNRAKRAKIDEKVAKLQGEMRTAGPSTSKGLEIKAQISRLQADRAAMPVKKANRRER